LDNRFILAAGEQPFTLTDAMHPALTECLASAAHVMRCANKMLEGVFEVAVEVAPVPGIQLQA